MPCTKIDYNWIKAKLMTICFIDLLFTMFKTLRIIDSFTFMNKMEKSSFHDF